MYFFQTHNARTISHGASLFRSTIYVTTLFMGPSVADLVGTDNKGPILLSKLEPWTWEAEVMTVSIEIAITLYLSLCHMT